MCRKMGYIVLIWAIVLGSIEAQEPPYNYYPGVVLVKFSGDVLSQANLLTITQENIINDKIRTFLENHNFTSGEKMFKHFEPEDTLWMTKSGRTVKLIDLSTYYALKVDINTDIPALSDSLMQIEGVLWAGLNWKVKPAGVYPNDPYFQNGYQWGLWDQYGIRADIRAPEAWDFQKGRNDVIVAVIDGGVDYVDIVNDILGLRAIMVENGVVKRNDIVSILPGDYYEVYPSLSYTYLSASKYYLNFVYELNGVLYFKRYLFTENVGLLSANGKGN